MYLRITKVKRDNGRVDEYIRLVESYWNNGCPKHRVICNLGRKDLLAPHAEALLRILTGKTLTREASAIDAWDWGPMLVARHLWQQLGLQDILDHFSKRRRQWWELSDRALALVANRVCKPTSEHGLARWLETNFVCDRFGNRWVPQWRDDAERLASKRPRVRVKDAQLRKWYGTLDQLIGHKKEIEKELFLRLRNLFSLNADVVFYDLTSTYFEGKGPEIADCGHSRDEKPHNRQVLIGLVMIDGWPIAHHVFEGNRRDACTLGSVLEDIQQRFGLRRIVLVGDRGMVTLDNIELLRSRHHGYVVGLNRRRRRAIRHYLERATGLWIECPAGETLVQEVASDQPGVRVFVVHSEERLAYERSQREKSRQRVYRQLQALQARVAAGKLKAPEKIGAAAARILSRNHGSRYYDWQLKDGQFVFFEHPVNLKAEEALEGKYLIQTEEANLSAIEAVQIYKELTEVERAFSGLKDVIKMRPIYHRRTDRTEAHIFVASLAFLLDRALEKKLKSAGMDISSKEAWELLKTVRIVDIDVGNGDYKRSVTRGTGRASRILNILGIKNLDPAPVKTNQLCKLSLTWDVIYKEQILQILFCLDRH